MTQIFTIFGLISGKIGQILDPIFLSITIRAGRAGGAEGAIAPQYFENFTYFSRNQPKNCKNLGHFRSFAPQYLYRPLNNYETVPALISIFSKIIACPIRLYAY